MGSHPESTIVFDYTVNISEENKNDYFGAKEFSQTMKEHHANEELLFSINEGEIESFLAQRALKIVDHFISKKVRYLVVFLIIVLATGYLFRRCPPRISRMKTRAFSLSR